MGRYYTQHGTLPGIQEPAETRPEADSDSHDGRGDTGQPCADLAIAVLNGPSSNKPSLARSAGFEPATS